MLQALAIDEHRGAYEPTLWTLYAKDGDAPPKMPSVERVEQRWFIGAHANVGGGYKNDPLSRLPLAWMQNKANALGLHFSRPVALTHDEHLTKPVDSYAKFMFYAYRFLTLGRRYYRPIGSRLNKVKGGLSFPVDEWIHGSVFRRWAAAGDYRPRKIQEWSERVGRPITATLGDQPAL